MEYIPGPHSLGKWAVLHDCQPRLYPTFNGWFGRFEVTILDGTTPALAQLAPGGRLAECLPPEFNVRTRVHEYSGGAFAVLDGVIYFANFKDRISTGNSRTATPRAAYRFFPPRSCTLHPEVDRSWSICWRARDSGVGHGLMIKRRLFSCLPLGAGKMVRFTNKVFLPFGLCEVAPNALARFCDP